MERSRRCQPDGQGEFIRLANDALLELCPAPVIPHRLSRCKKSTDIPGKVSAILTRRERMDNVPARSVRGLLYAVRPSASSQCSSVVEQLFRKLKAGYIPELTRGNLYIYSPKTKDIYSSTIILKLT